MDNGRFPHVGQRKDDRFLAAGTRFKCEWQCSLDRPHVAGECQFTGDRTAGESREFFLLVRGDHSEGDG